MLQKIILKASLLILIVMSCSIKNRDVKSNSNITFRESTKKDSLLNIDYVDKNYKYLDEDFAIKIDSEIFETIKDRDPRDYKDSLFVILYHELHNDSFAVNVAFHRILFSWRKLSYYILEDEKTAEAITRSFGFTHPYKFYEYLRDETISDSKKLEFLEGVKAKLEMELNETVEFKSYKDLLNASFKHNPERIRYNRESTANNPAHSH